MNDLEIYEIIKQKNKEIDSLKKQVKLKQDIIDLLNEKIDLIQEKEEVIISDKQLRFDL